MQLLVDIFLETIIAEVDNDGVEVTRMGDAAGSLQFIAVTIDAQFWITVNSENHDGALGLLSPRCEDISLCIASHAAEPAFILTLGVYFTNQASSRSTEQLNPTIGYDDELIVGDYRTHNPGELTRLGPSLLASDSLDELPDGIENEDGRSAVVSHKDLASVIDGDVYGLDEGFVSELIDDTSVECKFRDVLSPPVDDDESAARGYGEPRSAPFFQPCTVYLVQNFKRFGGQHLDGTSSGIGNKRMQSVARNHDGGRLIESAAP